MVSKTRMIELVRGHQAQAVERGLADTPALAAYRDERGRNWLHLCCMARPTRGSGAALDEFVEGGTPLHHAIQYSRLKGARALLAAGADPNAKDASGRTPFHRMLSKGIEMRWFRLFAEHGARGDIPDANGRTVADIMRHKKDPEFRHLAERLTTLGANR